MDKNRVATKPRKEIEWFQGDVREPPLVHPWPVIVNKIEEAAQTAPDEKARGILKADLLQMHSPVGDNDTMMSCLMDKDNWATRSKEGNQKISKARATGGIPDDISAR